MASAMQTIIEDVRTERNMRQEFRGSAVNFNRNHDFAVKEIIAPKHKTETDPNKRIANLAMPAIRAAAGDLAYEEFMSDKWRDMGNLGGGILHYADEIQEIDETKGTFELTQKILRKYQELEEQESDGDDEDGKGDKKGQKTGGKPKGRGDSGDEDGSSGGEKGEGDDEGGAGGASDEDELHGKNENMSMSKSDPGPAGERGSGTQDGLTEHEDMDSAFESSSFDAQWKKRSRITPRMIRRAASMFLTRANTTTLVRS
ncbi:PHP domain-containing protein [Xanthomonas phage JGB6]|nr:PHP domain-containing protein [Xanthomonas phage JGB6]